MKTKYVLLTAVSALMVATGANAKTEVATKAYTDSHLATGTISVPTGHAGEVVTVNEDGDGFIYTNKANALPTDAANGDVLTWSDETESWVAGEDANTTYDVFTGTNGETAGTAGLVKAPQTTDAGKFLSADGTWATPADTNTTYDVFTGTNGETAGTAGLVKAPQTADAGKFLSADGTWATPAQVAYDAGDGVAKSGDNKFSVKAATNGGITVTSDGVSVDKDAVLGADGCGANQRCALVVTTDASGNPAGYTWEQLTEPDGEVQQDEA